MADGGTPWCFAFESGEATDGPAPTCSRVWCFEWEGVDIYDAWTGGEIGFTSPAVMEAGRLADALIFEPGYVRGGPASISGEYFADQLQHMLARTTRPARPNRSAGCHQAEFLLTWNVPPADRIGTDIDFFMLPPIDPSRADPVIGTAGFVSALVDRPEVRAFMEFVASPEWGERLGASTLSDFISPNRAIRPLDLRRRDAIPRSRFEPRSPPWLVGIAVRRVQIGCLRSDAGRDRGDTIEEWARTRSGKGWSTGSTGRAPSSRSSPTSTPSGRP